MSGTLDISILLTNFCVASRELYNNFFRVDDPYDNNGWSAYQRYAELEKLLFQKMVIEVGALDPALYGEPNQSLRILPRDNLAVPAMINRDIDGGYWDFSAREIPPHVSMSFVRFFDWDQLACKDNQYVRVVIDRWDECKEAQRKHALIERRHIRFERAIEHTKAR